MGNIAQRIFRLLCYRTPSVTSDRFQDGEVSFQDGLNEAEDFFSGRYRGRLDLEQKSILDIGCGFGSACIYAAQSGAKRVVGVDIDEDRIGFARCKLSKDYPRLSRVVEFNLWDQMKPEKFDLLISFNSFEHYGDPENFILIMKQYLKPEGRMAVAFGPLWKSPWGGHISFMTRFPWAHLLFPESVIMQERRRFRPDEDAESFAEIRGGMNKMTLRRFIQIIRNNGLEFDYLETNISSRRFMNVYKILNKMPFCEEYFTIDVASIISMNP